MDYIKTIQSMTMDLEAAATDEMRSMIPKVQRYFELADREELSDSDREEMKQLELEINDTGLQ